GPAISAIPSVHHAHLTSFSFSHTFQHQIHIIRNTFPREPEAAASSSHYLLVGKGRVEEICCNLRLAKTRPWTTASWASRYSISSLTPFPLSSISLSSLDTPGRGHRRCPRPHLPAPSEVSGE